MPAPGPPPSKHGQANQAGAEPRPRERDPDSTADHCQDPQLISAEALELAGADTDDSPTIISSHPPRSTGPDSHLGKNLRGRRLGHFELIEPIGIGGMAAVIRATDLDLGRIVALKILPPEMAIDPEHVTRFKQEARAAARLDHENIARVYYCGEDQGLHFIAFEFVEGENLRTMLERRGRLPVEECIHYMLQVAIGLAHAGSRGVVHRDIKPSNIIVTPQGRAKIVDMGLARNLGPQTVNGAVTQSGITLGTFDYISPEQAIEPRQADIRSDMYSLGCTFYHVLTGQPPVPEGTAAKKLHHHQHVQPLDPRQLNPLIPDDLTAVLARMMAKDRRQRYQNPEHLIQHLAQLARKYQLPADSLPSELVEGTAYLGDSPLPNPPRLTSLVLTVVLFFGVLSIFLGWWNFQDDQFAPTAEPLWPEPPLAKTLPQVPRQDPIVAQAKDDASTPELTEVPIQQAATTQELLELLKQPQAEIVLTGPSYDLTLPTTSGAPPAALFTGHKLTLSALNPKQPPTIKLGYAPLDDGETPRSGTLTLRPKAVQDDRPTQITLRHLQFMLEAPTGIVDPFQRELAALSLLDADQVTLKGCRFTTLGTPLMGSPALSIRRRAPSGLRGDPTLTLTECYFAPGSVAVQLSGGMTVRSHDCAFAPHQTVWRIRGEPGSIEPMLNGPRLELHHVAVLFQADHSAAVIDIASDVPCWMEASACLFSALEPPEAFPGTRPRSRPPNPVIIRQHGNRSSETIFRNRDDQNANGYHQILAYRDELRSISIAECLEQTHPVFRDQTAQRLTRSPWSDSEPLVTLHDDAAEAFKSDDTAPELRVRDPQEVMGVTRFLGVSQYLYPLQPPEPAHIRAEHKKIWDPAFPADQTAPPGLYTRLDQAIPNLKPGDELLIKANGPIRVSPTDLTAPKNLELTIRPFEGYRPVLVPDESLKTDDAMFKMQAGQLTFAGVQFQLPTRPNRGEESRSLVTMLGGTCNFRDCVITLEERGEVRLSVAHITDPAREKMVPQFAELLPTPRLKLENSWVRGKGDLLTVNPSRPFELDIDNALVVLDGTLIEIAPGVKEIAGSSSIYLDRLTTYLSEHFLHLQASTPSIEMPDRLGLVPTRVEPKNCVFVPGGPYPLSLVRLEGLPSETSLREQRILSWAGAQNNLYGFDPMQPLVEIQARESGIPLKPYDQASWLAFTLEAGRPFAEPRFAVRPVPGQPLTNIRAEEFRIASLNPMSRSSLDQTNLDPDNLGADITSLPRLFADLEEEPSPGN